MSILNDIDHLIQETEEKMLLKRGAQFYLTFSKHHRRFNRYDIMILDLMQKLGISIDSPNSTIAAFRQLLRGFKSTVHAIHSQNQLQ